jgi:nucleoside phosphorylase
MALELEAVVTAFELDGDGTGRLGACEIVARATDIGMKAAGVATRIALEGAPDHVMIVGIAGGVDPAVPIGALIRPALVTDRATGASFATGVPGAAGELSCGDDFITDRRTIATLCSAGVVALDMESAAVAGECERARVAWSVHRAISDRPDDGLVDESIWTMTTADGHADAAALDAYLSDDPTRRDRLRRLANDATLAAATAAHAARAHLANLAF